MPVGAAKHRDDRGHSLRAPLDTGTLPKTGLVDKIIVLFGAGISRPEIRAGSAWPPWPARRTTTCDLHSVMITE